jgi:hypothetical protein
MSWTVETGFADSELSAPQNLDVIDINEKGELSIPWDKLQAKAENAKDYFPDAMMRLRSIFPLQPSNAAIEEVFKNSENSFTASIKFIFADLGIFVVHTPTLYVMLQSGQSHPPTIQTAFLITFYNLVIMGLTKSTEAAPVSKQIIENSDREFVELDSLFFSNLMSNGIFQHYFTDKRDSRAALFLCDEVVKYTLRYIQTLERKILRLSGLGYTETETSKLCIATSLPTPTDEQRAEIKDYAGMAWKSRQSTDVSFFTNEVHPFKAEPPTCDYVSSCDVFHNNTCLAYCECILWFIQSISYSPTKFTPNIPDDIE